jgi:lipopolysaccharide/colanic/teichoic acid biosynthesis glycosyltransferase
MTGKRALDLLASATALAAFAPVPLTAAAAIRAEDGGPVLFRQVRVGRGGAPFTVLKLRTMQDGRVTRVGCSLRGTGLDELPQFVNVLKGEMSVVGPRPLLQEELRRLGWEGDALRASVAPGITGPAQLRAGAGAAATLARDHAYAQAPSLGQDLRLIALSFGVNLFGKARVRAWMEGREGP